MVTMYNILERSNIVVPVLSLLLMYNIMADISSSPIILNKYFGDYFFSITTIVCNVYHKNPLTIDY